MSLLRRGNLFGGHALVLSSADIAVGEYILDSSSHHNFCCDNIILKNYVLGSLSFTSSVSVDQDTTFLLFFS